MRRSNFYWKSALIFIFIFTLSKSIIMAIETPDYKLIERNGNFEIREYRSFVIAKTKVQNDYKEATSTGFRRIANYIFGGNKQNLNIAMTAPVISSVPNAKDTYEIFFVMPKKHILSSLPTPNSNTVQVESHHLGKTAVIKFGGWATKSRTNFYKKELGKIINEHGLDAIGDYLVAQYNSPWALPPFRKNEIFIKIQ